MHKQQLSVGGQTMARNRSLLQLILFIIVGLLILFWIIFSQYKQPESPDSANHDEQKMQIDLFVPAPMDTKLPNSDDDFIRQTIENKFNVRLHVAYMAPGNDYNAAIEALL